MWFLVLAGLFAAEPLAISGDTDTVNAVAPKGTLVAIGGGVTTVEIADKAIELAGGLSCKVAIVAEANPETGAGSLAMWKRAGVAKQSLIDITQPDVAKDLLREANLIWMPGGLQGVFMNRLHGTGIEDVIRECYHKGAIVAGTSAGAAVMSKVMIGGRSDLNSLKAGMWPQLMDGLGLWPDVIVDQHFLQNGRFNRLTLATLDYPNLVGVGIDEETAVIVHGREFEVIGENNVTVIDARKSSRENLVKGDPAAARNLSIHILRAGMKFSLDDPAKWANTNVVENKP